MTTRRVDRRHEQALAAETVSLFMSGLARLLPPLWVAAAAAAGVLAVVVPSAWALLWAAPVFLLLAGFQAAMRRYSRNGRPTTSQAIARWQLFMLSFSVSSTLAACALAAAVLAHAPLGWALAATLPALVLLGVCGSGLPVATAPLTQLAGFTVLAISWWAWGDPAVRAPVVVLLALLMGVLALYARGHWAQLQWVAGLSVQREALSVRLQANIAALEDASRAKAALLAAASHDLRQPVHGLGMLLEAIDASDAQAVRARAPAITACVDSLADMLTQLLDHHRLQQRTYAPDLEVFDLAQLVEEVAASQRAVCERKGLHLTVDAEPTWVRSDASLLKRVVFNLLTNAIKFTRQGGVTLRCVPAGATVDLAVQDTGVGIAAEDQPKVFGEYFQSTAGASARTGLGLGLHIVRSAAELLGYPLKLESQLGRGTRISLSIPVVAAPVLSVDRSTAALPSLKGLRVGLLDDDAMLLQSLTDWVASWGGQPLAAHDTGALLAMVARVTPDLLVCDMRLGGSSTGLDAISKVRELCGRPDLPALLLTGDLDPQIEVWAREAGVRLAHKPVTSVALRRQAAAALAGVKL